MTASGRSGTDWLPACTVPSSQLIIVAHATRPTDPMDIRPCLDSDWPSLKIIMKSIFTTGSRKRE
jgi:hypothetical protein